MMQADWDLSQSLASDGRGVRCACVLPGTDDLTSYRIVTGTQGGSVWEFQIPSGNLLPIDYQHDHAVTALLAGDTVYVTGCKDHQIRIFDHSHQFLYSLEGHDKAVTSLAWASSNVLVSGSWDGTAKVWNLANRSLITTLKGHENTVSVCGLPALEDGSLVIATGSAGIAQSNTISDHSIRIWQVDMHTGASKLLHKVSNDHQGPIRDLCLTSSTMLASCSNDGSVKLRSIETGETLSTLTAVLQETPMLLSVTATQETLVTSAEDGHVIFWDGQGDYQAIRHPTCVWNVISLPEGDVGTCCEDGTLRIFTQASERMAPADIREAFAAEVDEAVSKLRKGPSNDEVAKLPKWELNVTQNGKSEGQVQLFNKDNVAIAAQWSMASQTWIEVGQVVGSSEDSGVIDGVKYDFVFPIEVDTTEGGVAKLHIGYNTGENPFVAAQRFIDAHVLPQYHMTQIADYIQQRVGHQAPTLGMDTGAKSTSTALMKYQHLPFKGYKSFALNKSAPLEKLEAKLQETGKLSEAQMSCIKSLIATLESTNRYHATTIDKAELAVVKDMLEWPAADAFPALDLARMTVLHPDATTTDKRVYWNEVLQLAIHQCHQVTTDDGTASVAVPMLSLRLFANCFRGGPASLEAVMFRLDSVLDCTEQFVLSKNKNIRLSVATLLLNISSCLNTTPDAPNVSHRVVSLVDKLLASKLYESEPTVRALLALGTVILASNDAKEAARALYLTTKVEPAASPHGDKAKEVARDIYSVLS